MKRRKLASIAFVPEKISDMERLATHALDHHVGEYALKGWEVSIGILDPSGLELMRKMMTAGAHQEAGELSLYCGSVMAEEWLFNRAYRVRGRKLNDPVLGEAYLFLWE